MGVLSLKLPDDLLEASRRCAAALKLSRTAYIRQAIERMNRQTRAEIRARRLADVSGKVRRESMRVNTEFAAVESAEVRRRELLAEGEKYIADLMAQVGKSTARQRARASAVARQIVGRTRRKLG